MHPGIARYSSQGVDESELVRRHATLIDKCARIIASRSGGMIDVDDLWSAGALGLLDASRRFDPTKGARLETFLERRIKGAMLDELRRMDHLPRRLRTRVREFKDARTRLEAKHGRAPDIEEVASEMGTDLEEVSSLEALVEPPVAYGPEHDVGTNAEEQMDEHELAERVPVLMGAVSQLPERLQILLSLRYVEGLTLREIAKILDVSEPRVCQLHAQAIDKLRKGMGQPAPES